MAIRVLLVDDVKDVRRMLRTALRFRGDFEVVGEASDGGEAVALARSLVPDVVVLDLGLPDLAGREVLTRIRAAAPESRVVVFSGADAEDRAWIDRHVEGYVLKDAELDRLVDVLQSVGRRRDTETSLELPQSLESAGEARMFVRRTVTDWDLTPLLDDAMLVASELAANAVTHASSALRIRLSLSNTAFRIDVIDTGSGTPEPQPSSYTEEHGRGLHLVAALTSAWGLEEIPGEGKVVWAEFPRPEAAAVQQAAQRPSM